MARSTQLVPALLLLTFILSLAVESARAYPPAHWWSKKFGSDQNSESGNAIATDPSGNIILGAQILGNTDFGGGTIVHVSFTDGVLAKYDPNGNHLWSRRFGGANGDDAPLSITTDAAGNIFVVGNFSNSIDFGLGALTSAGAADFYVVKVAPSGGTVWNKRFGGTSDDQVRALDVDASGNIFVTGYFDGTVNYGGSNLISAGSNDIFLLKLDQNGAHLASARFGGSSSDRPAALACDGSGNVIITGWFQGSASFGGSTLVSVGSFDIVLAKYDNNLAHQWSKRFGNTTIDSGTALAAGVTGDIYMAGSITGSVDFGGGALPGGVNDDIVLTKFAANGAHTWSKLFATAGFDRANALAVDWAGRPFMTGYYNGIINFGGGNLTSTSNDVFVAHFETTGAHRWSGSYGGSSSSAGQAIAVDAFGDVCLAGYFFSTINFGGSTLTITPPVGPDIFLAKFAGPPSNPSITTIKDVPNDQGRKVRIHFEKAAGDGVAASPVVEYQAYRDDQLDGWTFVGSVPAHGEPVYNIEATTVYDSTIALGAHESNFYVRAATASSLVFYDSPPFAGHSLDNLAPGVPTNFFYAAGTLTWDEVKDADFDYFTVYGSHVDAFGSATLINYSTSPALGVSSSPYQYYYVTATDFSGNEGKPAKVHPLSGIGETPSSYVLSVSNYPNPFNPRTTVKYTLPSRGTVTVLIYDARGARVRTLFSGERVAGSYSIEWDGRADNGEAVASGLYFARIEHNGATRTKKMVLLK